ncbi:hypothetical protein V6N13_091384 [Hibiscus sabdariffa]|uniref:Uncharacterized protein n=1 Tax=Hibiscus sabdariffa TaxID=183260 RepID=A0ABR2QE45_9ROSI
MYVSGDSDIDAGNNNYLETTTLANCTSYGIDFGGDQPTESPETYMAGRMLAEFSRPKISEGHDSRWDTLKGECKGVGSFTVNKAGRNYERKARQGRQRKAIEVSVL